MTNGLSRRDFLKKASVASAAIILSPHISLARADPLFNGIVPGAEESDLTYYGFTSDVEAVLQNDTFARYEQNGRTFSLNVFNPPIASNPKRGLQKKDYEEMTGLYQITFTPPKDKYKKEDGEKVLVESDEPYVIGMHKNDSFIERVSDTVVNEYRPGLVYNGAQGRWFDVLETSKANIDLEGTLNKKFGLAQELADYYIDRIDAILNNFR